MCACTRVVRFMKAGSVGVGVPTVNDELWLRASVHVLYRRQEGVGYVSVMVMK